MFYNNIDTIILKKNDYSIKQNSAGFDLAILKADKLKRIISLDNPSVTFNMKGANLTARGIDIFSSVLPKEADYFFSLNKQNRIIFIKENTLQFTVISH